MEMDETVRGISCDTCVDVHDSSQHLATQLVIKQREFALLSARLINSEENCKQYETEFEKMTKEVSLWISECL